MPQRASRASALTPETDDGAPAAPEQRAYWGAIADQRSPYHPVCRFFGAQRWAFVAQRLPLDAVASVLDIGCGRGLATAPLADGRRRLVGVDASLHQLRDNPVAGLKRVVAAADRLPFADKSFELVTCWEVLHHVPRPTAVVGEIARVARRAVIVFEPNLLNPAQLLFSLVMWAERGSLRLRRRIVDRALARGGVTSLAFGRGGLIFPNRCPLWLFALLRRLPFRWPLIGISRFWIAERRGS